ncbi:hypothetical protein APB76_07810 [Vibrio bivalvicida]|uniref:DUF2861 domain-containing protein n=2 Tax=Vibrio bivalvicida TaxID=1276888 RepID=A0A177Y2R9_9VIBR|nr:hypothetical protein APB76_07810 [Vibrio bivalvicida]
MKCLRLRMSALLLVLLSSLGSSANDASWFRDTPIQNSLDALMNGQPQQAWQELILSLSQNTIQPKHWQPVKEAILAQSKCGHNLFVEPNNGSPLFTLSIISRSDFSSSGYQVKLSTEQVGHSGIFELLSPQGNTVLSNTVEPDKQYQEWETSELINRPVAGVYFLKFNQNETPIIISTYDSSHWIKRENQNPVALQTQLPKLNNNCALPIVRLQWFDSNYHQVGSKKPLKEIDQRVELGQLNPPPEAQYLSASVLIYEYQPRVKVEYIHRVSLPFPNRDK